MGRLRRIPVSSCRICLGEQTAMRRSIEPNIFLASHIWNFETARIRVAGPPGLAVYVRSLTIVVCITREHEWDGQLQRSRLHTSAIRPLRQSRLPGNDSRFAWFADYALVGCCQGC